MARVCDVCEKKYLKGNLVPRGVGRRVTNRAIKKQQPNLRKKKFTIEGRSISLNICASCLKRIGFDQNKLKEAAAAQASTGKQA